MKFSDYQIHPIIKKNIQDLGYKKPTDIQFKAITPILKREDVLAVAQTGTGKTAAFAIPILHQVLQIKQNYLGKGIFSLVLVPTRELSKQIADVFEVLGKDTGIKIYSLMGGVEQDHQIKSLQDGIDILISTPGRMFDLIHQGHLNINNVKSLILDEADHMLDLGFIKDIKDIKFKLKQQHQTLFFSATFDEKIKKLAYSLVNNPIRIQISPKDPVSKNINHSKIFVSQDDKRFFLENVIQNHLDCKILVFVRTKVRAERVKKAMERVEIITDALHGDLDQLERLAMIQRFKTGELKILITTDVSARGIDIPEVDLVINYDLPDKPENYVHRVGRTGRGVNRGEALSFCCDEEKIYLDEIEHFLKKPIETYEINANLYSKIIENSSDQQKLNITSILNEIEVLEKQNHKKGKKKKKY